MSSSNTIVAMKKKSALLKNLEHLKAGVAIGFSLSGIGVVIAGIVAHVLNPAFGFVTIPLALQALLVAVIKKAPKSVDLLKKTMQDVLKDEDQEKVNRFVDDMVSTFSVNTARLNEPIQESVAPIIASREVPSQSKQKGLKANDKQCVEMNAYYYPTEDRYEVTPRFTK